jgi:hypothetical protein
MVWPLSRLTKPAAKPPLNKTSMAAIDNHYEELLRFFMGICLSALRRDLPQSIHHADASINILHHLDPMGLLAQLLTFSRNENNRKKNNA